MADRMARSENKRAATAYVIDETSAERAGLDRAVADFTENMNASRTTEGITSSATTPAATNTRQLDESAAGIVAGEIEQAGAVATEVAAQVLDGVAQVAERVIDGLAASLESLLGGGSSAPAPAPAPRPLTAKERHAARLRASQAIDAEKHAAALQEIAKSLGVSADLPLDQLEQLARDRDRGGGMSR
jgi:hypothetical protein